MMNRYIGLSRVFLIIIFLSIPSYFQIDNDFKNIHEKFIINKYGDARFTIHINKIEPFQFELHFKVDGDDAVNQEVSVELNGRKIKKLIINKVSSFRNEKFLVSQNSFEREENEFVLKTSGDDKRVFFLEARVYNYVGISPNIPVAYVVSDERPIFVYSLQKYSAKVKHFAFIFLLFSLIYMLLLSLISLVFYRNVLDCFCSAYRLFGLSLFCFWSVLLYSFFTPYKIIYPVETLVWLTLLTFTGTILVVLAFGAKYPKIVEYFLPGNKRGAGFLHLCLKSVKHYNYILIPLPIQKKVTSYLIILLFLSIIVVKSFISFAIILLYKREYNFTDLVFTYSIDFAIAFFLSLVIGVLTFSQHYFEVYFNRISDSKKYILFFARSTRQILSILLLIISVFVLGTTLFYLFIGYIFYEWGGYIEPQHIVALRNHGGWAEFLSLLLRVESILFFVSVSLIIFLSYTIQKLLHWPLHVSKVIAISILLFILSTSAYYPITQIKNFNPFVSSPLLLLFSPFDDYTNAIEKENLVGVSSEEFQFPDSNKVFPEYENLRGIAKGMNVIIHVFESTRKKSLHLYGYERNTMPYLTELSNNSMVFHNAMVNQPRTCKSVTSLVFGVYPDPKLECATWNNQYFYPKIESLLSRVVVDNNSPFYFGTLQSKFMGEGIHETIEIATSNNIDRAVSREELLKSERENLNQFDERILTQDLLKWTKQQKKPFISLIWSKAGHMPYDTSVHPFGVETVIDKYDNTLRETDNSIKVLIEGLKEQGILDNTLIVFLGDHGEAVGNHMDWGHGNYLYDHTIRIPFIIYSPKLFKKRQDMMQRFQLKDTASTLLFLLGLDDKLNQSVNIFAKTPTDKIYLSNVYQDYKLGMVYDHYKFVYRPKYGLTYLFDMDKDPGNYKNIIIEKSKEEIEAMKKEVLEWYLFQGDYIKQNIYQKK